MTVELTREMGSKFIATGPSGGPTKNDMDSWYIREKKIPDLKIKMIPVRDISRAEC